MSTLQPGSILLPFLDPNKICNENHHCVVESDEANENANITVTVRPLITVLCVLRATLATYYSEKR